MTPNLDAPTLLDEEVNDRRSLKPRKSGFVDVWDKYERAKSIAIVLCCDREMTRREVRESLAFRAYMKIARKIFGERFSDESGLFQIWARGGSR